jgi:hypothetical protein
MQRKIESKQRKTRMIALIANAAGTALSGLDSSDQNISMTDTGVGVKTIELGDSGFASADYIVQVTTATADTHAEVSITDLDTFVVNTFDNTDGTTAKDAICHILVIGSDVTDRY